jgi:hypothetical protein
MKIDLIPSNPPLDVLAAPLPLRDLTTAKLKNGKTETHAVSWFATFV